MKIMRDLFGPSSSARAYFGEDDSQPDAFAVCYTEYARHRSQRALHLHLFYIVETHRRKGAAKQMLAYLDRRARDEVASALTVSADLQNEPTQKV